MIYFIELFVFIIWNYIEHRGVNKITYIKNNKKITKEINGDEI